VWGLRVGRNRFNGFALRVEIVKRLEQFGKSALQKSPSEEGCLEFGHFPKGDSSSGPGLLYSATLGKTGPVRQPQGGCAGASRRKRDEVNDRERFETN
jgi:hypothetical protein